MDCSLQPHALFNLKAIYEACKYHPGPEGHDPAMVHGSEIICKVEHEEYPKGQTPPVIRPRVKPYNIKSITDPIPTR
jgi:hypothetical protein